LIGFFAFKKLAETLGMRSKTLRVAFSRNHLSIRNPEDVKRFLTQRFSSNHKRAKRPYQSAKHLTQWRFVSKKPTPKIKISRGENSLTVKLQTLTTNLKTAQSDILKSKETNQKLTTELKNLEA
jgi:hypothetical protein